jgi:Na+-driven multidrug efflux pump
MSATCLRMVAIAQPFMITHLTLAGALRGAGDTKWTLYASALGIWGVRLTLAYLLVQRFGLGLVGAWIGMTADLFVRAAVVYWRFSTGQSKKVKV